MVLPLLVLLCLGLLQLGALLWLRVRLQAAAQEAVRAYVVWAPQDPALARQKAETAAWLALRPRAPLSELRVELAPPAPSSRPLPGNRFWLSSGARLTQGLRLRATTPLLPGLRALFPSGAVLVANASILNEESVERASLRR